MAEPFLEALLHQRQLDQDGVMVGVSRQAVDETLAFVEDLRAQLEQAQDKFTKTILAAKGQAVELGELRATITRQRAWIEKAGHRRKCSVRAPHAATMDYKPTCDCGYSELTEN